jgi:hypothetical protein
MKNYTEEEKEMINEALISYMKDLFPISDLTPFSRLRLEKFQEANGLTPKPKLEVGKFYKLTRDYCDLRKGMVFPFIKLQHTNSDFATVGHSIYLDYPAPESTGRSYMSPPIKDLVEATKEEVKTALTKEVEKRGYTLESEIVSFFGGITTFYEDGATCFGNGEFWWHGSIVMKDGIWATIVKTTTKMSVAQLEAAHGYTNLEITK